MDRHLRVGLREAMERQAAEARDPLQQVGPALQIHVVDVLPKPSHSAPSIVCLVRTGWLADGKLLPMLHSDVRVAGNESLQSTGGGNGRRLLLLLLDIGLRRLCKLLRLRKPTALGGTTLEGLVVHVHNVALLHLFPAASPRATAEPQRRLDGMPEASESSTFVKLLSAFCSESILRRAGGGGAAPAGAVPRQLVFHLVVGIRGVLTARVCADFAAWRRQHKQGRVRAVVPTRALEASMFLQGRGGVALRMHLLTATLCAGDLGLQFGQWHPWHLV
mmetsp:Transcript_88164/g.254428  ORF Transcript_88164/g.254428 Transcript_88164/m.254428 type:complete len:276 (+) Transcript_88164:253-1080(+)